MYVVSSPKVNMNWFELELEPPISSECGNCEEDKVWIMKICYNEMYSLPYLQRDESTENLNTERKVNR